MTKITDELKLKALLHAIRKSPEEIKAMREKEAREKAFEKEQERVNLLNLRWRLCNVPQNYHNSQLKPFMENPTNQQDKLDVLNQIKVIAQIKKIDVIKTNIVFHGAYGKGKTYFSSYLVRKMIWENHTAGFVRAREYCDLKKNNSNRVDFFENIKFLVLDEVGDFDMPKWEIMWLKELIIARDANGFKTLVTTNLSVELLREFFVGRAEDRLINNSTAFVNFDVIPGSCSLRGRVIWHEK